MEFIARRCSLFINTKDVIFEVGNTETNFVIKHHISKDKQFSK